MHLTTLQATAQSDCTLGWCLGRQGDRVAGQSATGLARAQAVEEAHAALQRQHQQRLTSLAERRSELLLLGRGAALGAG